MNAREAPQSMRTSHAVHLSIGEHSVKHIAIATLAVILAGAIGCRSQSGRNPSPETTRWQEYQLYRMEKQIKVGMTPQEVIRLTGRPDFQDGAKWIWRCHTEPPSNNFADLIVTFEHGKVTGCHVWDVIAD